MSWGGQPFCAARKCLRRHAGTVAVTAGVVFSGLPAQAGTATGASQVTIVEPVSVVKIQDLRFGKMAAGSTAGTVTVDPNTGDCAVTGGVVSSGGCGFAEFGGQGVRRLTVRIQIPVSVTLTGPGGATMVASALALGTSPDLTFIGGNGNGLGNGNRRYQINSTTGVFTFRLGGKLAVGANQAAGAYAGTFPVTVQFQ